MFEFASWSLYAIMNVLMSIGISWRLRFNYNCETNLSLFLSCWILQQNLPQECLIIKRNPFIFLMATFSCKYLFKVFFFISPQRLRLSKSFYNFDSNHDFYYLNPTHDSGCKFYKFRCIDNLSYLKPKNIYKYTILQVEIVTSFKL